MASSKLIGTAPDQVPTNADLGELAFQNKDSVEFTGGKGGLSSLDLTAIAASKNVSAVDIFVYDTSKDSDGGAWRYRCQNTSWYNETLNTDIRGSRREFPSVAVIVLLNDTLHIYDGDSPDLPLWMTFVGHNNYSTAWAESPLGVYSRPYNAVAMLNGKLVVGMTSTVYYANNMTAIDFLMDDMRGYKYLGRYGRPISDRNIPSTGITQWADYGSAPYQLILGYTVNDVAMTVLPNAPIDAATGLPIPTIAVATNGGVSVIKHDGTVVNLTFNTYAFGKVGFTGDNRLYFASNGAAPGTFSYSIFKNGIPSSDISASPSNTTYYDYYESRLSQTTVNVLGTNGSHDVDCLVAPIASAGISGLTLLKEVAGNKTTGMVDYITSKYNTGWMPGDIKGAWLSDTTQETVVGAELVTNGDFSSSSGWFLTSGSDANATISGGQLTLYRSSTGTDPAAINSGYVIAGNTYAVTFTVVSATVLGNNVGVRLGDTSGTTYLSPSIQSVGQKTLYIRANSNGSIALFHGGSGPSTIVVDNFSVRLADADRSVNNKGLQVYGSITKTPVATSADLVAYSGFSASNYLEQPYNSALDFGTGDFCISVWLTHPNTFSGHSHVIARINPEIGNEFTIQYNESVQNLVFRCNGSEFANIGSLSTNIWTHIVYTRRGGVLYGYMNGSLKSSSTFAANISSQNPLRVGYRSSSYAGIWTGSLTLLRISATAPSDDQIKKMYNDEKVLFQDNAKATLYGTSDAVTALAYDQDTKLLHVGTSSGRSVFQGLRRVDNTTTAVSTSISAANGLVAEN